MKMNPAQIQRLADLDRQAAAIEISDQDLELLTRILKVRTFIAPPKGGRPASLRSVAENRYVAGVDSAAARRGWELAEKGLVRYGRVRTTAGDAVYLGMTDLGLAAFRLRKGPPR